MERMLTADDIASLLQISKRTVFRWVAEGLIPPPKRFCGTPRWPESVLDKWVAETDCHLTDGEYRRVKAIAKAKRAKT